MGMAKHEHHEAICRAARLPRSERQGLAYAEEEYYSEMKRHNENKAKRKVPIAPPHPEPHYEGRRAYPANPATDTQRFEKVCREADAEAKKTGFNIVVFKNSEGNYFTWEEKYISDANPIEALYTALAPAKTPVCPNCGHTFNADDVAAEPTNCPSCGYGRKGAGWNK